MQSESLYYREGSSDKVYHVQLQAEGQAYVVNFQYGRRGSSLQSDTKTRNPVSLEQAQAIFDRVIKEKRAKGYSTGAAGTPYSGGQAQDVVSGITPALLNTVEEADLEALLEDDAWALQQKLDGRRLMARVSASGVEGINRRGLLVALSETVARALQNLPGEFILDGEVIGDTYHVFDLLEQAGVDLRPLGFLARHHRLQLLLATCSPDLKTVPAFCGTALKRSTLAALKLGLAEGVVFKRSSASYAPGRPASGGSQLKFKFTKTLSAVVESHNPQRSVNLMLAGNLPLGSVTIPPNFEIPEAGAVVEVRYLYAFPGGALCQPLFLGQRDDTLASECGADQLVFKQENA